MAKDLELKFRHIEHNRETGEMELVKVERHGLPHFVFLLGLTPKQREREGTETKALPEMVLAQVIGEMITDFRDNTASYSQPEAEERGKFEVALRDGQERLVAALTTRPSRYKCPLNLNKVILGFDPGSRVFVNVGVDEAGSLVIVKSPRQGEPCPLEEDYREEAVRALSWLVQEESLRGELRKMRRGETPSLLDVPWLGEFDGTLLELYGGQIPDLD